MNSLVADLRYAARRIAAAPLWATAAVLTMALGIGAATAMYSVVDALLLKPLPYAQADELVQVWSRDEGRVSPFLHPAAIAGWGAQDSLFTAVEPFRNRSAALVGGGDPQLVTVTEVSGALMPMLGVTARIGRTLQPADEAAADVVVISDGLWQSRFGRDPAILGSRIRLDDREFDVVGVMPRAFRLPRGRADVWLPMSLSPEGTRGAHALARLRTGVSIEQAQARAASIAEGLEADRPLPSGWHVDVRGLAGQRVDDSQRYILYVLSGAVLLLLLIACANFAGLLLVQGAGRAREVALRAAIGASRGRLVRQLLTEALALAVLGGIAGTILASWAVRVLSARMPAEFTFMAATEIDLGLRVLAFAAGVTVAVGAVCGALPALRMSGAGTAASLRGSDRGGTGSAGEDRLRRVFVVAQLALSVMLLVGAGLLGTAFTRLVRVDPGFDPANLVAVDIRLPQSRYSTRQAQRQFFDEVAAQLLALPGVRAVTVAGGKPPTGGGVVTGLRFEIDGVGVVLDDPDLPLPMSEVGPDYFAVLGIPLVAGGTFPADAPPGSPSTIVVSREMAARLWKGGNPIGGRIRFSADGQWHTVVGVVGDVYQEDYDAPRGLFAAYFPLSRTGRTTQQETLIVRTDGDPGPLLPAIRERIWAVDPEQPTYHLATMEELYGEFLQVPRFQTWLMTVFATVGLGIAVIGLYAVLSYAMTRRTREFGIRLALGAAPRDVLAIVGRYAGGVFAAGMVAGAMGSVLLVRVMRSLIVTLPGIEPLMYVAVALVLGLALLAATWFPARRALGVDPSTALRAE